MPLRKFLRTAAGGLVAAQRRLSTCLVMRSQPLDQHGARFVEADEIHPFPGTPEFQHHLSSAPTAVRSQKCADETSR